MNDWNYYKYLNPNKLDDVIICDTRDFFVLERQFDELDKTWSMDLKHWVEQILTEGQTDSLFTADEIINLFKHLEETSGGKKNWRDIYINVPNLENKKHFNNGWLKYLRFYKINNNQWFVYTTFGNTRYILYKKYLNCNYIKSSEYC